jgi:hypothetical protein
MTRIRPWQLAAAVLALTAGGLLTTANAQPATGTITGRVVWSPCLRGIPLPMTPNAVQPGEAMPDAQVAPGGRPFPIPQPRSIPAGAALVAVQNSSLGTRTDETGRFTLSGVPAGQYLTVAAGPVAESLAATAQRPNVFVKDSGESMDIGTLTLGGQSTNGISCVGIGVRTNDPLPAEAAPTDEAP